MIGGLPVDAYRLLFPGTSQFLPAQLSFLLHEGTSEAELRVHRRTSPVAVYDAGFEDWGGHHGQAVCLSVVGHNGKECRVTPTSPHCAFAEYVSAPGVDAHRRIRIDRFAVAHYLAYLCDDGVVTGVCPAVVNQCSYHDVLPARHALATRATQRFTTLSCFNGWGLNTLRSVRVSGEGAPTAKLCAQFYPEGSPWAVSRLKAANSA